MKKFLILLALLFGVATQSWAISIPGAENPAEGPAVWLIPVYNSEASTTLDVGDVACWDLDSSTGDNHNYVNLCTAADTGIVAGVVYGADITAGAYGNLAVHGVVQVDTATSALGTVGGLACSSSSGGTARSCTTENGSFGIVTTANTANSANVFLFGLQ